MSQQQPIPVHIDEPEQVVQQSELPVKQVHSFVSRVVSNIKQIRNFQLKPFIEDIVTCFSIIFAYQYVSISYEHEELIQEWVGIEFGNKRTEAVLLLIFAVYLITLNILQRLTYSYETTPASKPIPQNWQEMEQPSQIHQLSTISSKNNQLLLTEQSYTVMIKQLLSYSIYGFVFILCATAYAYIGSFNKCTFLLRKEHKIINLEQVNFLIFWAVTAVVFYAIGKVFGRIIGIRTLHHFGLIIVLIVIILQIGVAHGFNMFIFL